MKRISGCGCIGWIIGIPTFCALAALVIESARVGQWEAFGVLVIPAVLIMMFGWARVNEFLESLSAAAEWSITNDDTPK